MREVVAYKGLKNMENYKTVSPKSGRGRFLTIGRGTQRRFPQKYTDYSF